MESLVLKGIQECFACFSAAFQLCKIEGRSYEEVAKILGISTATVNSHMTKSLQSIREFILKHQDLLILLMTSYIVLHTSTTYKQVDLMNGRNLNQVENPVSLYRFTNSQNSPS
ncbi:RNA polymerase sigma factor [Solitalea canadensis]|uniref:RNA polymerase sigma factor n=1 Tax=Solitalea canadensis TaxID=995 RepID=UPI0002474333|nr:sigma factor-like helix-turn-helix DNA-binding protein [Solitalea canadensis]